MTQGKTVAFVETPSDVRAAKAAKADFFVAAAPEAAETLTRSGFDWAAQEDFYDEGFIKALAEEALFSHRAWANTLESDVLSKVPAFAREGFKPIQAHYLPLKMASDALLLRSRVLAMTLDALAPTKILHPLSARFYPQEDLLFRESIIGRILPRLASSRGLFAAPLSEPADFSRPARHWSSRLAGLPRKLLRILRRRRHRGNQEGPLILLGAGYDTAFLGDPLERRGACVTDFSSWLRGLPQAPRALAEEGIMAWRAAAAKIPPPPGLEDAGMASELEERWDLWRDAVVPRAWETFLRASEAARREPVAAAVLPMTTGADDVAAVQALRRSGTTAIHYQHGGFNGTCAYSGWEVSDFVDFDAILSYGPGVEDHYAPRARRHGLSIRFEAVGSARVDALVARRVPPKRPPPPSSMSVLFYVDMYKGPTRYLCGEAMPDVSAYRIHRRVLEAFMRRPEHRYEFRDLDGFYPNPLRDFFRATVARGRIHRRGSLFDAALRSDLVIADMPSTGLLEVLAAGVPVILLSDSSTLELLPRAFRALSGCLRLATDADDFLQAIEEALAGLRVPEPSSPGNAYLLDYGTTRADGRSAERAADAVLRLAKTRA